MEQRKPSRGEGEGEEGEEEGEGEDYRAEGEYLCPVFTGIDKEKTTEQKENIYALFHRHR